MMFELNCNEWIRSYRSLHYKLSSWLKDPLLIVIRHVLCICPSDLFVHYDTALLWNAFRSFPLPQWWFRHQRMNFEKKLKRLCISWGSYFMSIFTYPLWKVSQSLSQVSDVHQYLPGNIFCRLLLTLTQSFATQGKQTSKKDES